VHGALKITACVLKVDQAQKAVETKMMRPKPHFCMAVSGS
jgi:hypothetical protein